MLILGTVAQSSTHHFYSHLIGQSKVPMAKLNFNGAVRVILTQGGAANCLEKNAINCKHLHTKFTSLPFIFDKYLQCLT